MGSLSNIFGSSNTIDVIELFLSNPEEHMNLSEIADRLNKTPGSIIHVIPHLVENRFLVRIPISKSRTIYRLNADYFMVKHLVEFNSKINHSHLNSED